MNIPALPSSVMPAHAAPGAFRGFSAVKRKLAQCLGMMNFPELPSAPPDHPAPFTDQLRLAVAAYLARF